MRRSVRRAVELSFVGNWDVLDPNGAATAGHHLQGPTSLEPAHFSNKGIELVPAVQTPAVRDFLLLPTHKGLLRAGSQGDQGSLSGRWFSEEI